MQLGDIIIMIRDRISVILIKLYDLIYFVAHFTGLLLNIVVIVVVAAIVLNVGTCRA